MRGRKGRRGMGWRRKRLRYKLGLGVWGVGLYRRSLGCFGVFWGLGVWVVFLGVEKVFGRGEN